MILIDFDNLNEKQTSILDLFLKKIKKYEIFLNKNLIKKNFFFLSNFLSKDIFSNFSYIGYCHIKLLRKQLAKTKDNIDIKISNYYLYKNLKINFINNKRVNITCKDYWKTKFILYLKIFFKFFYLLNFIFWQLLNKSSKRAKNFQNRGHINLYDTTFTYSCFENNFLRIGTIKTNYLKIKKFSLSRKFTI